MKRSSERPDFEDGALVRESFDELFPERRGGTDPTLIPPELAIMTRGVARREVGEIPIEATVEDGIEGIQRHLV